MCRTLRGRPGDASVAMNDATASRLSAHVRENPQLKNATALVSRLKPHPSARSLGPLCRLTRHPAPGSVKASTSVESGTELIRCRKTRSLSGFGCDQVRNPQHRSAQRDASRSIGLAHRVTLSWQPITASAGPALLKSFRRTDLHRAFGRPRSRRARQESGGRTRGPAPKLRNVLKRAQADGFLDHSPTTEVANWARLNFVEENWL